MLLNRREPIALHWPVIELAPVPGRPMFPVMRARLMMAWAVRVPSWLWFTPMVHQNETRAPAPMVVARSWRAATGSPVAALTFAVVKGCTWAAKASNPAVWRATKSPSTWPPSMRRWATP